MSEYAELLKSIPVGKTVRVRWHYPRGVGPPNEPSEFRGKVMDHNERRTHLFNGKTNCYVYHNESLLGVEEIE